MSDEPTLDDVDWEATKRPSAESCPYCGRRDVSFNENWDEFYCRKCYRIWRIKNGKPQEIK